MKKKILIVFLICCMLFGVASPAMAADFYPDPPIDDSNGYFYSDIVMFPSGSNYSGSDYLCFYMFYQDMYLDYMPDKSLYVELNNDGDVIAVYFPLPTNITVDNISSVNVNNGFRLRYWNEESSKWSSLSSYALTTYSYVDGYLRVDKFHPSIDTLVFNEYISDSSIKIYGTDENFPPAPPLVNLTEELIQKTPEALDLDGKLKILVPFGISCLALLISLPLLLKVLRRFLG